MATPAPSLCCVFYLRCLLFLRWSNGKSFLRYSFRCGVTFSSAGTYYSSNVLLMRTISRRTSVGNAQHCWIWPRFAVFCILQTHSLLLSLSRVTKFMNGASPCHVQKKRTRQTMDLNHSNCSSSFLCSKMVSTSAWRSSPWCSVAPSSCRNATRTARNSMRD